MASLGNSFFLFVSVRFNPWLGVLVVRKDVGLRPNIYTVFDHFLRVQT